MQLIITQLVIRKITKTIYALTSLRILLKYQTDTEKISIKLPLD